MSKADTLIMALICAISLFAIVLCSSSETESLNKREQDSCHKFCDLRNTEVKVVQTGICICE